MTMHRHGLFYMLVYFVFAFCWVPADDTSRVVLSVPDTSGSDYINASYIDVRMYSMCIYNN